MAVRIDEISYVDLKKRIGEGQNTILVPVGTQEAHGKHLPLGTDSIIALGLCERIADSVGGMVAPPFSYGITNSLYAYTGGSRVDADAYKEFMFGALDGFINAGFRKIILVNGHGGNTTPLKELLKDMTSLFPETLFIVLDWWYLDSDIVKDVYGGTSGHAGLDETAGVIYFRPELVREDLFDEDDWYLRQDGYTAYPTPAPMILEDGNSLPQFDKEKAAELFDKILDRLISRISRDIALWESNFGRES